VTYPGGGRVATPRLLPGRSQTVRLAVPRGARRLHGIVTLHFDAAIDYVPSRSGVSGDTRHFGAVLSYVFFD